MVWHFIGVYIINRILHDRLEIRNFSSRVEKYFTRSLRSLVKYFSTLEEKFRISARPCNILYIITRHLRRSWCASTTFTSAEHFSVNFVPKSVIIIPTFCLFFKASFTQATERNRNRKNLCRRWHLKMYNWFDWYKINIKKCQNL